MDMQTENFDFYRKSAWNCDDSQEFSLGVVKSIWTGYNTNEEFCDNSQKLSVEKGVMIWKLRETSIWISS